MTTGFLTSQIQKNRTEAVKNVLHWMGFKNATVDGIKVEKDHYVFTTVRGKIKKFIVFGGWEKYNKWKGANEASEKRLYQCLGFKVVLLAD